MRQHTRQRGTPDAMTPAWSRDLAEIRLSPFWRGVEGLARRDAFIEQAAQYATYDDLPHVLKRAYQNAASRQHVKHGRTRHR